eukprot:Gregarina_sp_Poly_1__5731@NODE_3012_length_1451_cov_54_460983_g1907_i0_p1_GENE_NODE_3012_length_1451_cov_54_460983_g1907_i0NODE_3012_length_1451_cov_54_460983_g1907_i0_p1_ORF_typecomplete_len248_score33_74Stk19/PF10494_9/1_7e05Mt_ATPsynt_D/PF05873_12/0_023_NODE_3012_length_1451_cov_54_460983_g1907_i05041247
MHIPEEISFAELAKEGESSDLVLSLQESFSRFKAKTNAKRSTPSLSKRRRLIPIEELEAVQKAADTQAMSGSTMSEYAEDTLNIDCSLCPVRFWTDLAHVKFHLERKYCLTALRTWLQRGQLLEIHLPDFGDYRVIAFTASLETAWRSVTGHAVQRDKNSPPSGESIESVLKALFKWAKEGRGLLIKRSDLDRMEFEWTPKMETFLFSCGLLISRGPSAFQLTLPSVGIFSTALKHDTTFILTSLRQ